MSSLTLLALGDPLTVFLVDKEIVEDLPCCSQDWNKNNYYQSQIMHLYSTDSPLLIAPRQKIFFTQHCLSPCFVIFFSAIIWQDPTKFCANLRPCTKFVCPHHFVNNYMRIFCTRARNCPTFLLTVTTFWHPIPGFYDASHYQLQEYIKVNKIILLTWNIQN